MSLGFINPVTESGLNKKLQSKEILNEAVYDSTLYDSISYNDSVSL